MLTNAPEGLTAAIAVLVGAVDDQVAIGGQISVSGDDLIVLKFLVKRDNRGACLRDPGLGFQHDRMSCQRYAERGQRHNRRATDLSFIEAPTYRIGGLEGRNRSRDQPLMLRVAVQQI
jgi:hypothetical protein